MEGRKNRWQEDSSTLKRSRSWMRRNMMMLMKGRQPILPTSQATSLPTTLPPPSFGLRPICLNNRSVSAGVYRRTHWPTLKYTKSTKTTPGAAASTSTDTCMHIYDSALGWHTIGCACVSVCEYLSVRLVYGCVCPHPQTGKGVAEVQGHSTRRLRRPG